MSERPPFCHTCNGCRRAFRCSNPDCKTVYGEYVNGCPTCNVNRRCKGYSVKNIPCPHCSHWASSMTVEEYNALPMTRLTETN